MLPGSMSSSLKAAVLATDMDTATDMGMVMAARRLSPLPLQSLSQKSA